jgi:glycosyltransferase involved in cell wall biosynthesis
MKILTLAPLLPDAPSDGDKLRLFHLLRALGKRHAITLACFSQEGANAPALAGSVREIHTVPMPRALQWANAGLRYFGEAPSNVSAFASGAMRSLVDRLIERDGYDALFCYRLRMAPYALRFRGRRVIDYTDSLTRYFERRALRAPWLKRRLWLREAAKIAAYEAWTARQFDAGLMNSGSDAATLRAMAPGSRILTAANGHDPRLKPRKGKRDPDSMVFIGNLAYPPNAEAVAWFAGEILPRIRSKRPQAHFVVLGSNAPASLRGLQGRPGVEFRGFVPEIQGPLASAAISVCPVRLAAGRQNKILDAFATATPVVATGLTAAGVEAQPGRHLLAADDAEGFAVACLRLLSSPGLRRSLAARALNFVHQRYDWSATARVAEAALKGNA